MRTQRIAIALFVLVLPLALLPAPPVQAALGATFTTQTVAGMPDVPIGFSTGRYGNKVGIAFEWNTANKIGFILGNATTGWTVKTTDIGVTARFPVLVAYGPSKWGLLARNGGTGTTVTYYQSTDDGATWAATSNTWTITAVASDHKYDLSSPADDVVGIAIRDNGANAAGGTGRLLFQKSTNGGTSFASGQDLNDDSGSPAGGATGISCNGGSGTSPVINNVGLWGGFGGAIWDVLFGCASSTTVGCVWDLKSTDGGGFWNAITGSSCPSSGTNQPVRIRCNGIGTQLSLGGERSNGFTARWLTTNAGQTCTSPTSDQSDLYTKVYSSVSQATVYQATDSGVGGASSFSFDYPALAAFNPNLQAAHIVHSSTTYKLYYADAAPYTISSGSPARTGTESVSTQAVAMTNDAVYAIIANTDLGGQTQIISAPVTTTAAASASFASRTFSGENIVGYDVDRYNHVVALRMQKASPAGQFLRSIDPTGLGDRGNSPLALGCGGTSSYPNVRNDGVMAYYEGFPGGNSQDYVGFIDCTASNKDDGNMWKIRSGALGDPSQEGTACAEGDFCGTDIDSGDSGGCTADGGDSNPDLPNRALEIQNVQSIPISWTRDGTTGLNHATVGFAFSDTATGNIGVWAITQNNDQSDFECKKTVPFSTPAQTYEICTWTDPATGDEYMAAVSASANTKVLKITVDVVSAGLGYRPVVKLENIPGPGSPWSRSVAIDCASGLDGDAGPVAALISNTGRINLIHLNGNNLGQKIWANDISVQATTRGIAISTNAQEVAYYTGTASNSIILVNGTTGIAQGSPIVLPAGTYKGMRMDDTGQTLWVFQNSGSNGVATEYDIEPVTHATAPGTRPGGCSNSEGQTVPCIVSGSSSASSTGAFCLFCSDTTSSSPTAFDAMRGWLFVFEMTVGGVIVGAGVGATTKDGKTIAGVAGLVGALGLAGGAIMGYKFGWLDGGDVFLIVFVVAVVGAAIAFFMRRG